MTIDPITLQSLNGQLGEHRAMRSCAPIDFYMLLAAAGYLDKTIQPSQFCLDLDGRLLKTQGQDWKRPLLSKVLRHKYHAPIVSWQINGPQPTDFSKMKAAGYIETTEEVDFYNKNVLGKSVEQIVRQGFPVIVTMKPGFGSPENKNIHAIIIAEWEDEKVTVIDPDARNPKSVFKPDYVNSFISPEGAGSIIPPKV
ncbi:MAG TPA: hypothetical protein VNA68_03115 [Candidatus Dormibacteraeota bacterium]|nr:hypothetical protein [Candidatus Dormibacteraeota bacterium]